MRTKIKNTVVKPNYSVEFFKYFTIITCVLAIVIISIFRISINLKNNEYKNTYKANIEYLMENEIKKNIALYRDDTNINSFSSGGFTLVTHGLPNREYTRLKERLSRLSSEFDVDLRLEVNGNLFADSSRDAFTYKDGEVYRFRFLPGSYGNEKSSFDSMEQNAITEKHIGNKMKLFSLSEAAVSSEDYMFSIDTEEEDATSESVNKADFAVDSYTVFSDTDILERTEDASLQDSIILLGKDGVADMDHYTEKYTDSVLSPKGENVEIVLYVNGKIPANNPWDPSKKSTLLDFPFFRVIYEPYKSLDIRPVIVICLIADVFVTLLFSVISYYRKKSVFEIMDYRKKTTNAMAHDLKTPLATISAFSENLEENVNTDKREYYAKGIRENVEYMTKLINDILEISRSESVGPVLNYTEVKLNPLIGKMLINYSEAYQGISYGISGEKVIKTDVRLFTQAVENIIFNAFKYAPANTMVKVLVDESQITITNKCDTTYEDVEKLKEPFVKGDKSRGDSDGSGLGLAIAEDNFTKLKMKMKLDCSDGEFIVSVMF